MSATHSGVLHNPPAIKGPVYEIGAVIRAPPLADNIVKTTTTYLGVTACFYSFICHLLLFVNIICWPFDIDLTNFALTFLNILHGDVLRRCSRSVYIVGAGARTPLPKSPGSHQSVDLMRPNFLSLCGLCAATLIIRVRPTAICENSFLILD